MDLNDYAIWGMLKDAMPEGGLEEIAAEDYGSGQQQHLAALREMMRTGRCVVPMDWYPSEVIMLYLWRGDSLASEREALLVLFCCAILLVDDVHPESVEELFESTVITAIHCAYTLGSDWLEALHDFALDLEQAAERLCDDYPMCSWLVYPLGCLILASLCGRPLAEREAWRERVASLCQQEEQFWAPTRDPHGAWDFLPGTMRWDLWRRYLALVREDVADVGPPLSEDAEDEEGSP